MEEQKKTESKERSVAEFLNKQYLEAEGREEVDYWDSLARIIMETIESRHTQGLSQADLASRMSTKQSVISRFENLGRKPSYDFIARLAIALGHAAGMSLYGEYMAVVPQDKHQFIADMAAVKGVPTQKVVEQLLEDAIAAKEEESDLSGYILDSAVDLQSATATVIADVGNTAETITLYLRKFGQRSFTLRPDLFRHLQADEDIDESLCGQLSAAGT